MNPIDSFKNMLQRTWSRAPDKSKTGMPVYYHTSPRLDPVRVIAEHAASVELKLYNKRDLRANGSAADAIDDHELYDLLDHPCPTFPELDGWTLRYLTFAHRKLCGEFFWVKVRNPGGHIIALLPVPAAWVPTKPTVGHHYFLIYPYGTTASRALPVAQEDVVWFKDVDLSDPYGNGRGAAENIADEIESDEYAAKYQKNFFYNDATPPFVIYDPNGNQTSAAQIKKSWSEKLAGWMHAREPTVLTGRDIKIEKLSESPKELDMVESRKFLRDEALQHFQIPPEIFGIIENSNRSTIDAAFYLFNKNVLSNELAAFERAVNNQLILPEYGSDIVCKHVQIIAEDEQLALSEYNAGVAQGLVTRNEWRTRFGLPEVPDGDVYLMPMALTEQPVGGYKKPEQDKPDETPVLTVTDDDDDGDKKSLYIKSSPDEAEEMRRLKIWTMFDAKASAGEPAFKKQVKKISSAQLAQVKDAVKSAAEAHKPVDTAVAQCFGGKTDEAVKRTLAPAWVESMKQGADHAHTLIGKKAYGDDTDEAEESLFNLWVEKNGLKKAKQINDTTLDELRKSLAAALSDSVAAGDSLGMQIKKLLSACEGVYDEMDKARAEMIARTETATSVNYGSFATYKIEGIQRKMWIATRDDRTRDAHLEADGHTVGIDEQFEVDGESLDFPGDPNGSAENVINCRCTVAPVVER